jgi:hypothetical protein
MRLGDGFKMEDEQRHAPVVVLSLDYWTHLYSRDPGILGQPLYIKGIPFAVIGVTAEGFSGVEAGRTTDFWIPLQSRPELNPWGDSPDEQTLYGSPNWWCLRLIARLARGLSAQQAVAEATPGFQAAAYASLGKPDAGHPRVTLALAPAKGIQGLGDNKSRARPGADSTGDTGAADCMQQCGDADCCAERLAAARVRRAHGAGSPACDADRALHGVDAVRSGTL